MIEALGLKAAMKLSRPVLVALAVGALFALGGFGYWRGMAAIERAIGNAAQTARDERNAHWKGEIARSNAEIERQRAADAAAALQREAEAGAEIARLTKQRAELERANAALPKGARSGISRARVRLLNSTR